MPDRIVAVRHYARRTGPVRGHLRGSVQARRKAEQEHDRRVERAMEDLYESDPILNVRRYGPGADEESFAFYQRIEDEEFGTLEEARGPGDDEAEWVAAELGAATHFVHTDPWRGYYDTKGDVGDLEKVVSTWVSPMGHSGDYQTLHQVPLEEIIRGWQRRNPPFDVFVVTARTSNLFSNTMEMYVHRKDAEAMKRYLTEHRIDPKDLA